MADEIKNIVSDSAFEQLKEASRMLKEMEGSPVARLKALCESVAALVPAVGDEQGTIMKPSIRDAYEQFFLAAIEKAKSLL